MSNNHVFSSGCESGQRPVLQSMEPSSVGLRQLRRQGRAGAENETTTGMIAHQSCSLGGATAFAFLVKVRIFLGPNAITF
jgi:hypothetical protein